MNVIFSFPGYEELTQKLSKMNAYEIGKAIIRDFPDEESYVRILSDVKDKDIFIVCGLDRPNTKMMSLLFFAELSREIGARTIKLIAPYLGYMRQDKSFLEGEAITSKYFAKFLSRYIDSLLTIDPHLHRYKALEEIYTVPSKVVHAAKPIAEWIAQNINNPLLIGPDEESEQWVKEIAQKVDISYLILSKKRFGDRDVKITFPNLDSYKTHTPVLVDDVISTAQTMIQTVAQLKALNTLPPICIGVHGVFAGEAYQNLTQSGVAKIVTCNTIPHSSNAIDISDILGKEMKEM